MLYIAASAWGGERVKVCFMKKTDTFIILFTIFFLIIGCTRLKIEIVAAEPTPYTIGSEVGATYLTAEGDVYTKGTDRSTLGFYQTILGQGEGITRSDEPVKILSDAVKVISSQALKTNGELWVWGYNLDCSIGLAQEIKVAYEPTILMDDVVDFENGSALKSNGELWGWHWTAYKDPITGEPIATTPVKIASGVKAFDSGAFIKLNGSLWIYGNHIYTGEYLSEPKKLDKDVIACSTDRHIMYIKSDGSLWGFGNNEYGQVGNGDCGDLDPNTYDCVVGRPVRILENVSRIYAKIDSTYAITEDGTLYGWGRNFSGMLGTDNEIEPSPVVIARNVKNLYLPFLPFQGYYTDENDALWAWGGGILGIGKAAPLEANVPYCRVATELLDDTMVKQKEPVKILENVKCVVGNDYNLTYALSKDGTYYRWGIDTFTKAKTYGEANVIVFCTFKPDGTQDKVTGVWSSLIDTGYKGELGAPDEEITGGIGYYYSQILIPEPCEFPG